VELLRVICDGSWLEYTEFLGRYPGLLMQHSIDEDALAHEMKLLTISSLAAQVNDKTLTFESIRSHLSIGLDEVELWVIEAIAEKLIDGSIDQLNEKVSIRFFYFIILLSSLYYHILYQYLLYSFFCSRYAHISFGSSHWKQIQQKLRLMRKNINTVIEVIERNKAPVVNMT